MANNQHVRILRVEGVKVWNVWRGAHPGGRPDLGDANLEAANLFGAYLGGANLDRAYLGGANLDRAYLGSANLGETVFVNIDLSKAEGLERCHHRGPSIIDRRTLTRSGPLPLAFLRGCGLSDWEIEAAKLHDVSLSREQATLIAYEMVNTRFGNAFQYHSCFISYSSADEPFCRKLHDRLQDAGIRTWFAPEDMRGGRKLFDQVEHGIQLNDKLLLVLTERSMQSEWVEFELRTALKREKDEKRNILFPIRLVDYPTIRA